MSGASHPISGDPTRSQIRGSSLLFGGQLFTLVVNLVIQVLIVRYLSKTDYGVFAYALSVAMICETIAAFGLRRGVARYMPIYEERGELDKAMGTLLFSVGTVLGIGVAAVLVVVGLRGTIVGSLEDGGHAAAVLAILIVLVPINALSTLLDGVFAVFGRARAITARKYVLAPLLRLVVVVLLSLEGAGVVFLASGYLAAGLAGVGLYAPMLVQSLRARGLTAQLRTGVQVPVRELLSFTVPLLTNDLAHAAVNSAAVLILGSLAGAIDVAAFRAVLPVALTMEYLLTSFGLLLVPLAARLYARGEREQLNRIYWQTCLWTTVLAYPLFAACVIVPEPLTIALFGDAYKSSAAVLAVLALGQYVNAAAGHNGVMLGVLREVRWIVAGNVGAAVVSVGLLFALVPAEGALGAAIAVATTFVALNVFRQLGLARRSEVDAIHPRNAPVYAVVVATTAVAFAARLLLDPPVLVSIVLTAAAVAVVLSFARSRLELAETFPELTRVPFIRRLASPSGAPP